MLNVLFFLFFMCIFASFLVETRMNRIGMFLLACVLCVQLYAQQADDVLMKVGEKVVYAQDFLGFLKESAAGNKNVDQSLDLYTDYLVKVAYAEKKGLDSNPEVAQLLDNLQNGSFTQEVDEDWVSGGLSGQSLLIGHIILPLSQHASSFSAQSAVKARMDSICQQIRGGQDFLEVAKALFPQKRNQYWVSKNHLLAEVENVAYGLKVGEMSEPFLATDGYHLIKVYDKSESETAYTSFVAEASVVETGSQLMDEYRNGVILNELYKLHGQEQGETTEEDLKSFFASHHKDYTWSIPHYKGMYYRCKDKKTAKAIAKLLKKYPMEQWDALMKSPVYATLFSQAELSPLQLFKLSQDPVVDELVFGGPKQASKSDYPFVGISGKKLKKGPDSYFDVYDILRQDYALYQDVQWMEDMRKEVPVWVNNKLLKKIKSEI